MVTRTFEAGDIVRVAFPYTDRSIRQMRPALVVSDGAIGSTGALLWVLMITSAENVAWPGDVPIGELRPTTGLPIPSVVRTAKIATVEARDVEWVGRVSGVTLATVRFAIGAALGGGSPPTPPSSAPSVSPG